AAHSDMIDLAGINYESAGFAETYNASTGILALTDGVHSASFKFTGFNGTLDFASDGHGGTLVMDPPAQTSSAGALVGVNHEQFVFRAFAGGTKQDTMDDFKPNQSKIDLDLFA